MPSERPQFNVRMDPETAERLPRVLALVSERLGIEVTQAQLLRLALIALEREHQEPEPKPKRGK